MTSRLLLAGIGNIFLGDDAFGVEVAARLADRSLPAGARVTDYGIRGVHLAYELLEGYDSLILVDAVPMGEPPGTLAVIEPEVAPAGTGAGPAPVVDAHSMSPDTVLATLGRLGGKVERVVVVGCQPGTLEEGIGLSPAVAAAVDGAVDLCAELISQMMEPVGKGTTG
jgi:hydrogenase maturation protease